MSRRWFLLLLAAAGGCSVEYEVRIRASDSLLEAATYAEVAIVANCLSQESTGPVTGDPHVFYELTASAPSLGSVPAGNHGLFARFIDEECNVRAAGCQDVEIEDGGDSRLTVEMRAAGGSACRANSQCVRGRCVYPADVGADVSVADARLADASLADAEEDGGRDAGLVDAGSDVGPVDVVFDVMDPCLTTAICDDFEGDAFVYSTDLDGDSTVGLSSAEAHSGTHSVLIHAAGNSVAATFDVVAFDSTEVGERWVRAWYLMPTVFEGITPLALDSGENSVTVFTTGEDYAGLVTFRFPGDETSIDSRVTLPTGRWTCLEMHLDYGGINTAEFFIDGAAAAEMSTALPNAFPVVRFGAVSREPDDPTDYDIYIDDIAMAPARMGCN